MSIASAPLASLCTSITDMVEEAVFGNASNVEMTLGAPGRNGTNKPDKNQLNVFFYRFEPFGFNSDLQPEDTLWLRAFCIITAFGITDSAKAGENELRMLSHVMRFFHENPVLMIPENTQPQWYVEFILKPLQDGQINQLWSTQGSVVYHPSVIYEIALNPIVPTKQADQVPHVGQIGAVAFSNMNARHEAYPGDRAFQAPIVAPVVVNTTNQQWLPAICLVLDGGLAGGLADVCSYTQSIEILINGGTITTEAPDIWIAGDESDTTSEFKLLTNLLQKDAADAPVTWATLAEKDINKKPASNYLDADNIVDATKLFDFKWPDELNIVDNESWQIQLVVERRITIASGEIIKLNSNTLLISVWKTGGAP